MNELLLLSWMSYSVIRMKLFLWFLEQLSHTTPAPQIAGWNLIMGDISVY